MITRTIEVSAEASHLSVRHEQLLIRRHTDDESAPLVASVPCEDVGLVLIDHPQTTFTHQSLATLLKHGAAVMICGADHLPAGLLLPMSSHCEVVWRIAEQVSVAKPVKKRLWKQIVAAKVRAQAHHLQPMTVANRKLLRLAADVKSGDTTNVEAQAARAYWQAIREHDAGWAAFRRKPRSKDPINAMLNYGYSVMRAAVARALVSAGLQPAIGIHHANRSNAFCLADDMVEPLRPMVDRQVRRLVSAGETGVSRPVKQRLLGLLQQPVVVDDQQGPLLVALHRYAASLVRCFAQEADRLEIPTAVDTEDR